MKTLVKQQLDAWDKLISKHQVEKRKLARKMDELAREMEILFLRQTDEMRILVLQQKEATKLETKKGKS